MKKLLALTLCVTLALALLAGCGGGGDTPAPDTSGGDTAPVEDAPSGESAAVESDGSDIELSMWTYFSPEGDGQYIPGFVEQFEGLHPGIKINSQFVPRDDLLRQYTMGAVSGDLPDISMVDNPDHASFSAMGVFEDITDYIDAWGEQGFFFEGPMMSAMYEGRVYGLPNNSNCLALFYNVDMLEEAGVDVPTTWDELEAACAVLSDGDVYGLAISAVKNEEGTFQFMPWFISADGSIDDLGGPGPVRAVNFLNNLMDQGYMSRDVINWTQGDANQQFINGLAAMQVNGPWNVPNILNDAPDLNWAVALVPRDVKYASVLGGENFAIGANPTDLDAAVAFLTWFMSKEVNAEWCASTGKFPTRSDSLTLKDIWTEDPVFSVFGEGLQYAMPRGPHPRWPEISEAISTAFHEVYTGARSAEDALQDAAAKYSELVS